MLIMLFHSSPLCLTPHCIVILLSTVSCHNVITFTTSSHPSSRFRSLPSPCRHTFLFDTHVVTHVVALLFPSSPRHHAHRVVTLRVRRHTPPSRSPCCLTPHHVVTLLIPSSHVVMPLTKLSHPSVLLTTLSHSTSSHSSSHDHTPHSIVTTSSRSQHNHTPTALSRCHRVITLLTTSSHPSPRSHIPPSCSPRCLTPHRDVTPRNHTPHYVVTLLSHYVVTLLTMLSHSSPRRCRTPHLVVTTSSILPIRHTLHHIFTLFTKLPLLTTSS